MHKTNLTRYKQLQHFKAARKGVINNYSENINFFITILQNISSAVIKSTINHSSNSITLSNDLNISDLSSFSTTSNIATEIIAISNSNGSLIFVIDGKSHKSISSNETHITVSIADLIIYEGYSLSSFSKPGSKKVVYMARNISNTYSFELLVKLYRIMC